MTVRRWLIKSEPDSWSWDAQVKAGAKGTAWTGVRNHTAKLNLMKMKTGVTKDGKLTGMHLQTLLDGGTLQDLVHEHEEIGRAHV